MPNAGAIRAAKAYVEVEIDQRSVDKELNDLEKQLQQKQTVTIGGKLGGFKQLNTASMKASKGIGDFNRNIVATNGLFGKLLSTFNALVIGTSVLKSVSASKKSDDAAEYAKSLFKNGTIETNSSFTEFRRARSSLASNGKVASKEMAALSIGISTVAAAAAGAVIGIAAFTAGIVAFTKFAITSQDAALKQRQAYGKLNVVFKSNTDLINEAIGSLNKTTGIDKTTLATQAAQVGDFLVPRGFNRKETAALTRQLLETSAAIAAFNPGETIDSVSTALQAALRGEADPVERFGINAKASRITQELGFDQTKATDKERTAAILKIIEKDSKDALDNFAKNGIDPFLMSVNKSKTAFKELREQVGNQFSAPFASLLDSFAESLKALTPLITKLSGELADSFTVLAGVIESLVPWVQTLGGSLAAALPEGVNSTRPLAAQSDAELRQRLDEANSKTSIDAFKVLKELATLDPLGALGEGSGFFQDLAKNQAEQIKSEQQRRVVQRLAEQEENRRRKSEEAGVGLGAVKGITDALSGRSGSIGGAISGNIGNLLTAANRAGFVGSDSLSSKAKNSFGDFVEALRSAQRDEKAEGIRNKIDKIDEALSTSTRTIQQASNIAFGGAGAISAANIQYQQNEIARKQESLDKERNRLLENLKVLESTE